MPYFNTGKVTYFISNIEPAFGRHAGHCLGNRPESPRQILCDAAARTVPVRPGAASGAVHQRSWPGSPYVSLTTKKRCWAYGETPASGPRRRNRPPLQATSHTVSLRHDRDVKDAHPTHGPRMSGLGPDVIREGA